MRKGQYYLDNVLQTNKPGDTFDWKLLPDQRLKYYFNEDYTSSIYEGVPLHLTNLDTGDTGLPKNYLYSKNICGLLNNIIVKMSKPCIYCISANGERRSIKPPPSSSSRLFARNL